MTPADTFMSLWQLASEWDGPKRLSGTRPPRAFTRSVESCLKLDDGASCNDLLKEFLQDSLTNGAENIGNILEAMRILDHLFYMVHPRCGSLSPSAGRAVKIPQWLKDLRDFRSLNGFYCATPDLALVPRGPLLRNARAPNAAYADTLADRFAALSVVPLVNKHEGRKLSLSVSVVSTSVARGVPAGRMLGAETVAFIPVGEAADDVHITERRADLAKFASFTVNPDVDVPDRIIKALQHVKNIDLAVAPEFMVSESVSDDLSRRLALSNSSCTRMLVAGTGLTKDVNRDQPWNECQVLNGFGFELWRQRKIWPAGLATSTAESYGLSDPGPDNLIYEDTAAGDTVKIVDLKGMGRCVILICQDLKLPATSEIVRAYQPDWVLTPIFDVGVCQGRWMHNEAWGLSELSQSRFVIASSLSMGVKVNANQAYGMAIGPKELAGDIEDGLKFENRAFQYAMEAATNPKIATITWGSGKWLRTRLGAE